MAGKLETFVLVLTCGLFQGCGDFDDFDRRISQSDAKAPAGDAHLRLAPTEADGGALGTPDAAPAPADAAPAPAPAGTCGNAFETDVFQLTNQQRVQNGLAPFLCDAKTGKVARAYSELMCKTGHFDHIGLDGSTPLDRMVQGGVSFMAVGENIAAGAPTPAVVVNGWMNSPGHRANILSSIFTHIGVGYAPCSVDYLHYWTQDFFT